METRRTNRQWLDELAERLELDWVSAYSAGQALTTSEVAFVIDQSDDTVRRRVTEAASLSRPIGVLIAEAIYLIDVPRMLDFIEWRYGKHERLKAEGRLKKVRDLRSARQLPTRSAVARAS
jgi:hypothetical protein